MAASSTGLVLAQVFLQLTSEWVQHTFPWTNWCRQSVPRSQSTNSEAALASKSLSPTEELQLPQMTGERQVTTQQPESPTRGLRSSPPTCTASLIAGSSKAPWPWLWPWIGSTQGHIHIHSTCRTASVVSVPYHVTAASRSTEIWLFEFPDISTFGKVWTLVIAFLEGNSKIGLRQAVDQVTYYDDQPSVLSSVQK